jgi:hypothetical protein
MNIEKKAVALAISLRRNHDFNKNYVHNEYSCRE